MEMMKELENCQPELFFQWFQRICSIPHPSYHEEKLCDFLVVCQGAGAGICPGRDA